MRLALFILSLMPALLFGATGTSITVRNITFNFADTETFGQYANGDYWVVGPVTITSMTPASSTTGTLSNGSAWWRNGAMVNPTPSSSGPQGFDNAMNDGINGATYSSIANVDPGHTGESLVVSEGTVIKAISQTTRPPQRSGSAVYTQLTDMEYLTVVVSEPAAGSFRPPPVGTDKTSLYTTNDLDYSILRSLPVLSGAPSKATVEGWFLRPWASWIEGVRGRTIKAGSNMPNYGRESGRRLGNAGLVLHSDIGDKSTLFIRLVQIGIDTHATIAGDLFFLGDGGINPGWKFPTMLAGMALGDTNILYDVSGGVSTPGSAPNANRLNFAFDRQTWYVLESDVGRVMEGTRVTYGAEHVGLPEWGFQHWLRSAQDDSRWTASYRPTAFSGEFSTILAGILLPGRIDAWGWPATIEYFDRYMADFVDGSGNGAVNPSFGANRLTTWEGAMYDAYRSTVDEDPFPDPPEQPSGLAATATGTTTVNLTWSDNSTNETGFQIGYGTDGLSFPSVVTSTLGATSRTITGLAAGTLYFFRVRAENTGAFSGWSNIASAETQTEVAGPPNPTGTRKNRSKSGGAVIANPF